MKAWTPPYGPKRTVHLVHPEHPAVRLSLCQRVDTVLSPPTDVCVLEAKSVTCPSCLRALTDLEVTE